jgi:peptidoglycan/LPS O-acetylase OafA/YrhL
MTLFDEAMTRSHHTSSYRPEIDGLRALAVIAVLINHLQHQWLPGGFLGVDLFFVISGYVVTASLARRQEINAWQMLAGFYTRRFRRLIPALLAMVVFTSLLFSLFVSSADDQYALSIRTGAASLFGISNLWLLKQGNNYFDFGTQFNPFLHTWSLGVEEQFYLFWPLLVILCGVGFKWSQRSSFMRLLRATVALSAVSIFVNFFLWRGPESSASFYLMPARFWELSAGAIIFLAEVLWPSKHQFWRRSPLSSIACLLLIMPVLYGFILTEAVAGQFRPIFVMATAGLLASLKTQDVLGRCLSHPASLAIGVASYSLYLWHWPLIVFTRWTIGIHAATVPPLILLIVLATTGSYWLENKFRFSAFGPNRWLQPLFLYPMAMLFTGFTMVLYAKPLASKVFLGSSVHSPQNFTITRSIPGTTITTYNCFIEPDAPVDVSKSNPKCMSVWNPDLPTLFFEGDSIAHSLIPMLGLLHSTHQYNISFFARGGCVTPYIQPWPDNRHRLPRYQGCAEHAKIRVNAVLAKIKPGDQLVLATTNAYVQSEESQASYRKAISDLAQMLEHREAGLIIFSPFPYFSDRTSIKNPLSLCFQEWFRPRWAIPPDCQPSLAERRAIIANNSIITKLQRELQQKHKNIHIFDPLPILCPKSQDKCSTHIKSTMMFFDGLHLTGSGAEFIAPAFQSFLTDINPAKR